MAEETYVDELIGSGWIPGWPGFHSHGSRIIRRKADGEIVDVLPPLAIEETQPEEQPKDEAPPPAPIEAVAEEAPSSSIAQPESEVSHDRNGG